MNKNVYLTEVGANIDDLTLKIRPLDDGGWGTMSTELLFDQGQVVMEVSGLEYAGVGKITDPSSGI